MAEVLSLSLLLSPLLFDSTDTTSVSQRLHPTSSSSITQALSPLYPGREVCWRPQWEAPAETKAQRSRRRRKEGACLDFTLTYGQGTAGANTSWELESTHSTVVLDPHASLNQRQISVYIPTNACIHPYVWVGVCACIYIHTYHIYT